METRSTSVWSKPGFVFAVVALVVSLAALIAGCGDVSAVAVPGEDGGAGKLGAAPEPDASRGIPANPDASQETPPDALPVTEAGVPEVGSPEVAPPVCAVSGVRFDWAATRAGGIVGCSEIPRAKFEREGRAVMASCLMPTVEMALPPGTQALAATFFDARGNAVHYAFVGVDVPECGFAALGLLKFDLDAP